LRRSDLLTRPGARCQTAGIAPKPLLGAELFAAPAHDYTRSLLDAIPLPGLDPDWIGRGAESEQH